MSIVEIERPAADSLSRRVWRFAWGTRASVGSDGQHMQVVGLSLYHYAEESRPRISAKFRPDRRWSIINQRESEIKTPDLPRPPDDVLMDAMMAIPFEYFPPPQRKRLT